MQDLVIIGGGPGGYVAAIRASQLNMRVTLIEKDSLGGTCLNRGCVPTKVYYQSAQLLRSLQQFAACGISATTGSFELETVWRRKTQIVQELKQGISGLLSANGVEVISGTAEFTAPQEVSVAGRRIAAKRILIATGSTSSQMSVPGADLPQVLNSDQLLELTTVPERLVVIGGGVIGLEFSSIFKSYGSKVTIIKFRPELLPGTDKEITKRLRIFLKRQGIDIITGAQVESFTDNGAGVTVTTRMDDAEVKYEADAVLLATRRLPYTAGLGLTALGLKTDANGYLQTNADFQTNIPSIYAIGDVIGGAMLAHVASEEGRVAVERMAGIDSQMADHAIPAVIFTTPELATVGLSEEAAKQQGIDYRVGKCQFGANSKAVAMGETDGLVKVLTDSDGVIIGAHILGPHASDLIAIASLAVKERLTAASAADAIYPHPTLSEAWLEAVLDCERQAIHLMPRRR